MNVVMIMGLCLVLVCLVVLAWIMYQKWYGTQPEIKNETEQIKN